MSPRREGRASGDGHGDADGGGRHRRGSSGGHGGRDEGRQSGKGHDDANEGGRHRRGRSGDHGGRDEGRRSSKAHDDANEGGRHRRGRSGDHGGRDEGSDSADGYDNAEGGGRRRRGAYRKSGPGGETRSHGGGGSLHPRASAERGCHGSNGAGDGSHDLYRGHRYDRPAAARSRNRVASTIIREATSSSRALGAGINDRRKDDSNLKRKRNELDNDYDDHDLKRSRSRKSEAERSSADVRTKSKYYNESSSHYQQNNGEPRESRKHQTGSYKNTDSVDGKGRQALADGRGKKECKSGEHESPGSVSLSDIERSVVFEGRVVKKSIKGQGSKVEQDEKVDIMYAFDRLSETKETYRPSSSEWNKGPEKRYPQFHHERYLPERPDLEEFHLITDRFEPQPESPGRFLQ